MSSEPPSRRRVALSLARSSGTVVLLVAVYYVMPLRGIAGTEALLLFVVGLAVLGVLILWQLRAIVRAQHPVLRAVETFASAVPLFLLIFAAIYVVLATAQPDSFSEPLTHTDALYFTITVFATVGFGDITPLTEPARGLVTIQMVGNLLVLGLLVRSILDAVRRGRSRQGPTPT